jgi:hypothetical protein
MGQFVHLLLHLFTPYHVVIGADTGFFSGRGVGVGVRGCGSFHELLFQKQVDV